MAIRTFIATVLLSIAAAAPATAKEYSAERFDSRIRLLDGGSLEVTETVVFRFEEGTFEQVFREIPRRRTDGIEVVSAAMDNKPLPFGSGRGQVEVQPGAPVRIRWHFNPLSGSTHTFVVTYIVRGVVQLQGDADVLEWYALPSEHDYHIASSEVTIEFPAALARMPQPQTRRVGEITVQRDDSERRVRVVAREISRNGWILPRLEFNQGDLIVSPPLWQQRQLQVRTSAPDWMKAAAATFIMGLALLALLRRPYVAPPDDSSMTVEAALPPEPVRPAIAGALAAHGRISLEHAMATLFALADRDQIAITEQPRKWGQRTYTLERRQVGGSMSREEEVVLSLVFGGHDRRETVTLAKARGRVTKKWREFRDAVRNELRDLGLLDDDRIRLRRRYTQMSGAFLVLAALLVIPAAVMTSGFGGWPFLVVGAVAILAVIGLIFQASVTPLTDEGVRRARRWRAYRTHVKDIARDRAHATVESPSRLLPLAVALGLANVWSQYLKRHPIGAPAWFHALSASADDGAFPAFIAAGGAGDGGGGGAGGGGAAGGGASGAG